MTQELTAEHMNTSAEQRRGIAITVISIVAVMTLFITGFVYKITSPRVMSAEELRANGAIMFDNPRIIKDFSLLNHQGEAFTLADIQGKWSLIYFGFSHCPDICPTTLAKLNQVVGQLDPDIAKQTQVLMVSLDPARDTPDILAQYVPFFNPDFIGVSGEFLEILKFSRNVNVAFSKVKLEDDYTIDHTGNLVLINPKGHYHGFFKPPFELARLKTTYQSIVSQF
ncbi:hypothetical protein TDB9533_03249 [Thalassocella blandensis]|nr:hypothetical protein TDB9533_03249 [Thalassocella blandensis]